MRLNAYVMAADPAFLAASLRAYYPHVGRVVVSFDESARSWTGTPLPVEECLEIIRAIDVDAKCVYVPGHYARLDHDPLVDETFQRQSALDVAADDCDWVLQLDTDEVIPRFARFHSVLEAAERAGADGVEYPARWLYTHLGGPRYLEASTRFGRTAASFPGPLAVRSGTRLRLARQAAVPLYRADLRPWNTDPAHPRDAIVHEVVARADAVIHYSWVRSDEQMRRKFGWSGHAAHYSRPEVYRRWAWRSAHPWVTAASSPVRRDEWFRVCSIGPTQEQVV